jgi:hypothetical protein
MATLVTVVPPVPGCTLATMVNTTDCPAPMEGIVTPAPSTFNVVMDAAAGQNVVVLVPGTTTQVIVDLIKPVAGGSINVVVKAVVLVLLLLTVMV